jgi:alkanesulfonate monooxygenase SsuD/methylene tetrahydromethanopterin reductase-like flavin-dependent oxidoreductase (luciferase family)
MYGTTDNLQFGNDGAMAAARRKERMKEETAQLKGILKGIVTGQKHGAAAAPPTEQQGKVTVEFGNEKTTARPPQKPKKQGLGRLLQKSDKEEPKVVIGVE